MKLFCLGYFSGIFFYALFDFFLHKMTGESWKDRPRYFTKERVKK